MKWETKRAFDRVLLYVGGESDPVRLMALRAAILAPAVSEALEDAIEYYLEHPHAALDQVRTLRRDR